MPAAAVDGGDSAEGGEGVGGEHAAAEGVPVSAFEVDGAEAFVLPLVDDGGFVVDEVGVEVADFDEVPVDEGAVAVAYGWLVWLSWVFAGSEDGAGDAAAAGGAVVGAAAAFLVARVVGVDVAQAVAHAGDPPRSVSRVRCPVIACCGCAIGVALGELVAASGVSEPRRRFALPPELAGRALLGSRAVGLVAHALVDRVRGGRDLPERGGYRGERSSKYRRGLLLGL